MSKKILNILKTKWLQTGVFSPHPWHTGHHPPVLFKNVIEVVKKIGKSILQQS